MRRFPVPFVPFLPAGVWLVVLAGCVTQGLPEEAPSSTASRSEVLDAAVTLERAAPGRAAAVGSGRSMAPVFGDNSVIVTQPIPYDELEAGMIVAFFSESRGRVIHQLTRRTEQGWRSQGLNNAVEDAGHVTPENLIGVVYGVLQSDGD